MKKLFLCLAVSGLVALSACNSEGSKNADAGNEAAKTETTTPAKPVNDPAKPANAGNVDPDLPKTTVEFQESTLDLGFLKQGEKGKGTFKFTNTGNEPLIISSAKGSCGCTVPKWPKEPIAPGESAEIDIEFNSKGKKGKQTKTVTIQANTDPNPTRLTVKADVEAPAEGEAAAK